VLGAVSCWMGNLSFPLSEKASGQRLPTEDSKRFGTASTRRALSAHRESCSGRYHTSREKLDMDGAVLVEASVATGPKRREL